MDPHTLQTIKKTIWKHLSPATTQAFIFGSRATQKNAKFSDIDIGLLSSNPIPPNKIIKIKEHFENSNLPYIVEIVDFSQVDDKFKQIALQKTIPLNP